LGMEHILPKPVTARLGEPLGENDEREDYLRASLARNDDGALTATPFSKQDSSMFATIARSDALIIRAPFAPAAKAGETVEIIPLEGSLTSI
ncbi:MAG: molybdopterin molybdenumtransferase MoeA, partial [Alphaproteobacteria bacterium]|nr:molybdopterin molybdenumtransferase MoeA [Alphaproteobacteria bacterium]